MKIAFMGTPEFALPSLQKIVKNSSHNVVCVVTAPDRPKGRGRKLAPPPVKVQAQSLGLPVLQPIDLEEDSFLKELEQFGPDILVTVAFRILPRRIFELPARGAINLHGSLLPKYRGAAPIQWAIIKGEETTGVTTFKIDKGIDTGGILLSKPVKIAALETAGELAERLSVIGADLLVDTLNRLESGDLTPTKQDITLASKAPKITPELMNIDWKGTAQEVANLIRGLSPASAARTSCNGIKCKMYRARKSELMNKEAGPGEIIRMSSDEGFVVNTAKGAVDILEIQREGKRMMHFVDFIKGSPFQVGDVFA